jgi:hypothetical protein
MTIKFANNASAPLASAISSTSTAVILTAGRGAAFPTLGADDYFYATLVNSSNQLEIVKVTARAGDTLTVVRGQDGTASRSYSAGDKLELRITAAGLDAKFDVEGGEISNAGTPLSVNSTDSTAIKVAFKDNGVVRGQFGASATKAFVVTNAAGTEMGYFDVVGNFYLTEAIHPSKIVFPDATEQSTAFVQPIPTGTLMLFQQTAAPTGWTKQTTHNDKALRVVSGTASSGGTSAFTTVFANQTPTVSVNVGGLSINATTLSTAQMPSHNHTIPYVPGGSTQGYDAPTANAFRTDVSQVNTQDTGGGGSHSHSMSGSATATASAITLNVQYVDLIIASKN